MPRAPEIDKVRAFYDHPGFIHPFATATTAAIERLDADGPATVVFTAHSIPEAMAQASGYEAQVREACRLVAERAAPGLPWRLAWQSRSGPPHVPWLEPDVNDELEGLADAGVTDVVLVPIGFVSDHMEVVFDLDVQAAATARRVGLRVERAVAPGTLPEPAFVAMWADLIEERIAVESDPVAATDRVALGTLDVRPDVCPLDCCPAPSRGSRAP